MVKQQVPDFVPERLFNSVKADLEKSGSAVVNWCISKNAMIATLNYIRGKGYKCEWIENGNQDYSIKITATELPVNLQVNNVL
jgi:hypothetical protein